MIEAKTIEETITDLILNAEESNINIYNVSTSKQQEWIKRNWRYTSRYCNLYNSPSKNHRNYSWSTR